MEKTNVFSTTLSTDHERKSREKDWLELALKSGEVGAWYWDLDQGKEIVRTDIYNQLYGLKPERIWTQDDWIRHVHPLDQEKVATKMGSAINGISPEYQVEYRIIRDDGSVRWVSAWGKATRDVRGRIVRIAGVTRDITEVKRVLQDRDQFVATLSHDLRNPLAAARLNAELVERQPNHEGRTKLLNKIIAAIERTDRIIQDLLDSSRAKAGKPMHLSYQECDLRQLLAEALGDLSLQYGERFRFETKGNFSGTWACESLRRVLENLVVNAIKYGSTNEPVHVALDRIGETVTLAVHNEGKPIPDDEQKTLFEPFSRAPSAESSSQRGWGLGLTVVHSMAEALHGQVTVKSGTGIGTTFFFVFPITADQSAA